MTGKSGIFRSPLEAATWIGCACVLLIPWWVGIVTMVRWAVL